MFYSHEVLTSRKYGVATVWLVATLGSKANLKKVTRKAIRNVDVPKACQTIMDPAAPMALRLQGNLLYGVSRVYLEQCGYVLSDAQNTHNSMHMMLKVIKNAALDPQAGKARPDQLILPDDPSFLPDFALPPPEPLLDLSLPLPFQTPHSGESQSLSPFGSQQNFSTPGSPADGLVFPSSSSRVLGELRVEGDDGPGGIGGLSGILGVIAEPLLEPDFGFDADGNFIDFGDGDATSGTPAMPPGSMIHSDVAASARVRQEHEGGQQAGPELLGDQMDLDLPIFGDDLPEGEAFPTAMHQASSRHSEALKSPSTVIAPMHRKKRAAKVILADLNQELRNTDLADWNNDYLQNMKEASRLKDLHRAARQAKKNAEYWVWGAGIGGLGIRPPGATGPTPWDQFYGDNLFELYTGLDRKTLTGTKRDRDSGIDEETQGESRRVRHKPNVDEQQIGRTDQDEVMFMHSDEEVELPREAPLALDDQQVFSSMPWNMSASIRGSSAIPRSGHAGMIGSVGGSTGLQGSLQHRASRMVSASPLHGRGQPGGLEALRSLEGDDEFGSLGPGDFGLPPGLGSDGISMEPEPNPGQFTRVREALSAEGENFLIFVADAIVEKRNRIRAGLEPMSDVLQVEAAADVDEVLFEEVLPPAENNRMVACQGLLMVLALGTKGMLNVRQDEAFGEIGLALTDKAKDVQAAVGKDEQAKVTEDEEGQFEGQMAAEIRSEAEEYADSLYSE